MARIFLSHSSLNNPEAIAVREWLSSEGWDDVFLDLDPDTGLKAGERWQEALKRAATRCETVLFLISPEWVASKWCLAEFLLAKQLNKQIFGVLIRETPLQDLPLEMTSEWQIVDLTAGALDRQFEVTVSSGSEPEIVSFSGEGLKRLRIGLKNAGLDPDFFEWPPRDDPMRPPYRGMRPMEAEDAGIFFGREGPIIEVMDRLRGLRSAAAPRLLVILGASGSGKSSFLRAGLLPRLARDDRHFRCLPVLRPDRAALTGDGGLMAVIEQSMATAGIRVSRGDIREAIETGAEAVKSLLSQLTVPAIDNQATPTLILSIDQAEELFNAEGLAEAEDFLRLLNDLVTTDDPAVTAVFTIRSDQYEKLQTVETLTGLRQQTYSLPPLPKGVYGHVIKGPARRLAGTERQLVVEEALTEALLRDVEMGAGKDALPLLSFTLERLFREYGGDGSLKLSEYQKLGGVRGSIEAAVEQALVAANSNPAIPTDHKARMALIRRGLIPWLAGVDPETGAPRRRIARKSDIPPEALPLVELLVDQRLLAVDVEEATGGTTIEPAHEALLRQWGLLEGWLEEDFEDLSTAEGVRRAVRDWDANAKDPEWIAHFGGRLELAEAVAARADFSDLFSATDREYLAASRRAENARRDEANRAAQRLQKRTMAGLVVAVVLAVTAAVFGQQAFKQSRIAEDERLRAVTQADLATSASERAQKEEARAREQAELAEVARQDAIQQADVAEERRKDALLAQSGFLSQLSAQELEANNVNQAILLAIEALPDQSLDPNGRELSDRPAWPGVETILRQALRQPHEIGLMSVDAYFGIWTVAISPDRGRILTSSRNGVSRIWNANATDEFIDLVIESDAPTFHIVDVAFIGEGDRFLAGHADGTVRVWSTDSGQQIHRLEGHTGAITEVAIDPNGRLAVSGSHDGTARLWDIVNGSEVAVITEIADDRASVNAVDFSPDGTQVLTGGSDGTLRVFDVETLTPVAEIVAQPGTISDARFSPDGTTVLSASNSGNVRLLNVAEIDDPHVSLEDSDGVWQATFVDGGRSILGVSSTNSILWDARTGAIMARVLGTTQGVSFADASSDTDVMVTTSRDGTARVWDLRTGQPISVLRHPSGVISAALSNDGTRLVTGTTDSTIHVWDVEALSNRVFARQAGAILDIDMSPDGRRLLTGSEDRSARQWDADTGAPIGQGSSFETSVTSVAYSPDGSQVMTGTRGGEVVVLDALLGEPIVTFADQNSEITDASFDSTASHAVTATKDGTVQVWDIEDGNAVAMASFSPEEGTYVNATVFSPDGKLIFTADQLGRVDSWSPETSEHQRRLQWHFQKAYDLALSPDGTSLMSTTRDQTASLTNLLTGEEIAEFRGHTQDVTGVAISPDGTFAVTGSWDKTAIVWALPSGELLDTLRGNQSNINTIAIGADGRRVFTGAADGTVRVWPVISEQGQPLLELAKSKMSRCLTQEERTRFFLNREPPRWCITGAGLEAETDPSNWRPKPPYNTSDWVEWLARTDRGQVVKLPE